MVAPTPEPTDRRDRRVDDSRGGFVLKARSDDPPARRKSLTEKSLKKGILSVRDFPREQTESQANIIEIVEVMISFLMSRVLRYGNKGVRET